MLSWSSGLGRLPLTQEDAGSSPAGSELDHTFCPVYFDLFYLFVCYCFVFMAWFQRRDWKEKEDMIFVNDQIKAPTMLLVDENSNKIGLFPRQKVIDMSQEEGKDIVQLHYDFNEKVATVRLVDLGKYLYEKQRTAKEKKKNQKTTQMKQIKFSYNIGDNDFALKMKQIRSFLSEWNPVKVSVKLRWREKIYAQRVVDRIMHMQNELRDVSKTRDQKPKQEWWWYLLILFPKGK